MSPWFKINTGVYTLYVRKIQEVLFRMIQQKVERLDNQSTSSKDVFRERWERLSQRLGFSRFRELLEMLEGSGIQLGFLYFNALHVHIGLPRDREGYPLGLTWQIAKALNNPRVATSMLIVTASTPALYGEWVDVIDSRYGYSGILPTTQRFPREGYATDQLSQKKVYDQNVKVCGANTLDRMAAFNVDDGVPVMHGQMRQRLAFGTIEFTGASAADPFASAIYAMMAQSLVLAATIGLDIDEVFSSASEIPSVELLKGEEFFQKMIELPQSEEDIKERLIELGRMERLWSDFFEYLFNRVEEDLRAEGGDDVELALKHYQWLKWYRFEILENFERLRRGFLVYWALQTNDIPRGIVSQADQEVIERWSGIAEISSAEEIISCWLGNCRSTEGVSSYEIPIWALWFVLKKKGLTPLHIENLLRENVLHMYGTALDFFERRSKEVMHSGGYEPLGYPPEI